MDEAGRGMDGRSFFFDASGVMILWIVELWCVDSIHLNEMLCLLTLWITDPNPKNPFVSRRSRLLRPYRQEAHINHG